MAITFVPTDGGTGAATASNTNGQSLDITINISSGADLLIILDVIWGQATVTMEDWTTTTEPFALLTGTAGNAEVFPNLGGDVSVRAYGVINPTAKTNTITATQGGSTANYHLMAAVAYDGVETSSLNAAANNRETVDNNSTVTSTTVFSSAGTSGNGLVALCGALGNESLTPAITNNASFTERAEFCSDVGIGNADGTIYIADLLTGLPSACTVTWPFPTQTTDENAGFYIELIAGGNEIIIVPTGPLR